MSWGTSLVGFGSVMSMLDNIQTRFDGDAVYVVGTNVEYGVYVEFGTSKMEAQPYLFRAARQVDRSAARIATQTGAQTMEGLVKAIALEIEALAKRFVPVDTGNLKGSIRAERVR